MKYKRLSESEKLEICDIYQNRYINCPEIARFYSISATTVRNILKSNRINRRPHSECHKKYKTNHNYFNIIDTQEKAYFLGWMYSDGYNYEDNHIIKLALQSGDIDILHSFNKQLESDRIIKVYKSYQASHMKDIAILSVSSKNISRDLSNLGCFQKKSLKLKFPTEKQVPDHLLRHFIRGYFDGDGCFYSGKIKHRPGLAYYINITSTLDFCKKIKEIVDRELDITSKIIFTRKKESVTTRTWLTAGRLQCCKFGDWLYKDANIFLQRKYQKYLDAKSIIPRINQWK